MDGNSRKIELPKTTKYHNFNEYFTKMSRMFPLLKCKHPGSVSREFPMGCFPVHCDNIEAIYSTNTA
ncbi:hypothetical protein T10_9917 [Trichinella papuae]|uniref:Uncharacterized protein n=1 Tax=Trichinella papuae TaxID=268474 RepID=A0A0V1M6I4_9BILA|nr:hypothetical protein T10_9917 [Trichinella papuae]